MPDLSSLLDSNIGIIGVLAIIGLMVFAESGLLVGLLLPGDTLLFAAGFFAARGDLPFWWTIIIIFVAAIAGDNVGYYLGQKTGTHVFKKREGIFFRKEYVERATTFYDKHGGKTIMFARFIGYIRTIAPIVAGAAKMPRSKFVIFNVLGAFLWTLTFVLVGYWFGVEVAEQLERYLFPAFVIGLILFLSPTILYFIKSADARAAFKQKFNFRKR